MSDYISTKETAQLIRTSLKRTFPNHKFSVRTQSYSMGSHVLITWDDGPTQTQVDDVVGCFYGSGFDGMCDSSYCVNNWLMPDGTVTFAHSSATSTRAAEDAPKPHPDARLVSFGGSRPSLSRHVSEAFYAHVRDCFTKLDATERAALIDKTGALRCLAPYQFPDGGWHYDATLSDFGANADQIFNHLAWNVGV